MNEPESESVQVPTSEQVPAPVLPVTLASGPPLRLDHDAYLEMLAAAYDGYPLEACGLLGGKGGSNLIEAFVPVDNLDASARTYAIGPAGFKAADDAFSPRGLDVIGVMHSHTHTDAYPSSTDIDQADNPFLDGWKYIIVSLRDTAPVLRSYVLDGRHIVEEVVELVGR